VKKRVYCSECGKKISAKEKKSNKKGFIISAGILIIIAAGLCMALSGSAFLNAVNTPNPYYYNWDHYNYNSYDWIQYEMNLVIALVSIFAFSTGVVSGLLILKRSSFKYSLIGIIFVNIASILSIGNNVIVFLLIGLPVFVLSLITMIFTIHSKEFFK